MEAVNATANLVIVFGYLLVPLTWLSYLPLSNNVRIAGGLFFATCALTHLGMSFGFEHHPGMVINHVVQAIAVVWFVLGFAALLRAAHDRRTGASTRGQP